MWLGDLTETVAGAPNDNFLLYTDIKNTFYAIQSTFRSLEIHSKWHYKYLFGHPRGTWVFSKL